ncbi:MAG TPA: hypothetical protein ENN84_10030 [Candidatus Marinimicrobia bacterium]|nr:hypothetical protein [Candidatus Neomarinimicrobiota bacterium]
MADISKIKDIEECIDGILTKEFYLSTPVDKRLIDFLSSDAVLQYYPNFSKTFYKIRKAGLWELKGIEGENSIRVTFKSLNHFSVEDFISFLRCYLPE